MSTNGLKKISTIKPATNSLLKGVNKPIYAFKDDAVGFTECFSLPNDALAVRTFTELCNNKQTPLGKYYNNMSLWKLGEFNDVTGQIIYAIPEIVIQGKQVVINKEEKC